MPPRPTLEEQQRAQLLLAKLPSFEAWLRVKPRTDDEVVAFWRYVRRIGAIAAGAELTPERPAEAKES